MKQYKNILLVFLLISCLASCTDFLQENHESRFTAPSLFETSEGIEKLVLGLYNYERALVNTASDGGLLACHIWMDRTTDIVKFMTGGDASLSRYTDVGPDSGASLYYNDFWKQRYYLIGRANEIVHYGQLLGDETKRSVAEGAFWRAYCYYGLWTRFGCAYLNTTPIDKDNVDDIVATRTDSVVIFKQMLDDVDLAIKDLPIRDVDGGRIKKATALHLKALIKTWQHQYNDVLDCVDEIDQSLSTAGLRYTDNIEDIFKDRNSHNNPEVLFSLAFSRERGGIGNRLGSQYVAQQYNLKYTWEKIDGEIVQYTEKNLGRNWGVAFPNSYLMSLYPNTDKRLDIYYKRDIIIMNPDELSKGLVVPPAELLTDSKTGRTYYTTSNRTNAPITLKAGDAIQGRDIDAFGSGHRKPILRQATVSSIKYFDREKPLNNDGNNIGEKDIMVYRLTETYLLGAEAAVLSNNSSKAVTYFNKSWTRAGNPPVSAVTFDMIRDEQARELSFEGRRWEFLKRNGIWYTQMRSYAGDFTTYPSKTFKDYNPATYGINDGRDPKFGPDPDYYADFSGGADRDAQLRFLIQPHYVNWPVPQEQINAMGASNFPQTAGY